MFMCKFYLIVFFVQLLNRCNHALVGYDCRHPHLSYTVIDGVNVKECNMNKTRTTSSHQVIQLLQRNPILTTKTYRCYIMITKTIARCGMHSHTITVRDGFYSYMYEPSYDECIRMVNDKTVKLFGRVISSEIKLNARHRFHIFLAGTIHYDESCEGTTYRFMDRTYYKVVVQAQIDVLFSTQDGKVDLEKDTIHITSLQTQCKYSNEICISESSGHIAWSKDLDHRTCEEKEYEVIYEGPSTIESQLNGIRIINVISERNIFSLVLKEDVRLCNQMGLATEHNRLFIVFVQNNNFFFRFKSNNPLNVDLIAYINTKIVYVERHINERLNSLYHDILQQRCLSQASILSNLLALAYTSEDEFAYAYKKEPGYTALTRGEVIHLIKCVPVEVKLTDTHNCYTEATVLYKNITYFLSPRNRLLKEVGTEIECNSLLPVIFNFAEHWYSLYPTPHKVAPPHLLDPNPNNTWVYESPKDLMSAGLYGLKEVEALQNQMFFAGEQKSLDSSIIRKYRGENIHIPSGDISNLFTQDSVESFSKNVFTRVTNGLSKIGDITSVVIGVVMIVKLFLVIVNFIFNYMNLRQAFGNLNWRSCCFFSEGITHFLLNRHNVSAPPCYHDVPASAPRIGTELYPIIPAVEEPAIKGRPSLRSTVDPAGFP